MNDMNGEKTAQVIATAGSRRGLQLPKLSRDVVANRSISIRAGATTSVSVRHQLTLSSAYTRMHIRLRGFQTAQGKCCHLLPAADVIAFIQRQLN